MTVNAIAAKIIEANKDFDGDEIRELIVSRVNRCDFAALVEILEPHVSSNDPNGAKFAVQLIERELA